MERLLIVDGHSAIFAIEELRVRHRGARRYLARVELVRRVRDLGDHSGWHVVVVFDGAQSERSHQGGAEEGIMVIYSKGTETADTVIERLATRFAAKGDRVRVATNDGMIRTTVTTFGAAAISIAELETWMATPEIE